MEEPLYAAQQLKKLNRQKTIMSMQIRIYVYSYRMRTVVIKYDITDRND